MDKSKFIRCRNCDAIHHVTAFDKAPLYALVSGGIETTYTDDRRAFMQRHAHHRLEALEADGEKYLGDGKILDPMGVAYIQVTNGQDTFVLRRSRTTIAEPVEYDLLQGRILGSDVVLEVQGSEIKKEMKHHFNWAPATPPDDGRIELLIDLFKEVVKGIDPRNVKITEYSHTERGVAYGLLEQDLIEALLLRSADYFVSAEQEAIGRFIKSHCEGCDVMTLRVRRHFRVEDCNR